MTEPLASKRLRSSLLDRLTDHHPERRRESGLERTVDEAELRELVRRDLTWLFNTTHLAAGMDFEHHPHVESSVLNFGIPDLTGRMLSSIQTDQIRNQVLDALRRYEPRLLPDSTRVAVQIGANRAGTAALVIDIEAQLWAEPMPLALYLRTEVDVESGRVAIDELRSERGR
jgi:type VI secretion system protein ImpF